MPYKMRQKSLSDEPSTTTLLRGLGIEQHKDVWRYRDGLETDRLFPVDALKRFMEANEADRLVLSGVAGAELTGYRSQPLVTKSGFEKFGFDNLAQSFAFVGAYVVEKLSNVYYLHRDKAPAFALQQGALIQTISLGGDLHGDFRMYLTEIPHTGIVSPVGQSAEFVPTKRTCVSAYHSVEPYLTMAMIRHEYHTNGKSAATDLVHDMVAETEEFGQAGNETTPGAFGDYGSSAVDGIVSELEYDIQEHNQHLAPGDVLSMLVLAPQSKARFEIVSLENGLRFQNRSGGDGEPDAYIDIPRERFSDLYIALLWQAQQGLGRSAPNQHAAVILRAHELLSVE